MKKPRPSSKRLTLSRDTVRQLSCRDLQVVVGGENVARGNGAKIAAAPRPTADDCY